MDKHLVYSAIGAVRYSVDLWTAALLLTGRIYVAGVFIVTEGFYLSATGPAFGAPSTVGVGQNAEAVSTGINVIAAFLLICNAIRVTGPYVSTQRLTLVFSGPIFGIKEIVGAIEPPAKNRETAQALSRYVRNTLVHQDGR